MAPLPSLGPPARNAPSAPRARPKIVPQASVGAPANVPPLAPAIPSIRLPIAPATPAPAPPRIERPITPPPVAASLFGEPALAPVVRGQGERGPILATLAAEVARCTRCAELAATRTQTVFGEGSPTARLMFVGEATGRRRGRRPVGRSSAAPGRS